MRIRAGALFHSEESARSAVSSLREALRQYAGRTWSGFSFTGSGGVPGSAFAWQAFVPRRSDARSGLLSVRTTALGGTDSALINDVYAQNDLGRLQSETRKLTCRLLPHYHRYTKFPKKRSPKAVGP